MNKLYCYQVYPIDWWEGALTAKELLATLRSVGDRAEDLARAAQSIADIETQARVAFGLIGWEGDIREGPYFFALPGEGMLSIGCAIKQDNNGTTFVASPYPLPWLGEMARENTCVLDEPVLARRADRRA